MNAAPYIFKTIEKAVPAKPIFVDANLFSFKNIFFPTSLPLAVERVGQRSEAGVSQHANALPPMPRAFITLKKQLTNPLPWSEGLLWREGRPERAPVEEGLTNIALPQFSSNLATLPVFTRLLTDLPHP
jgi:hypothetical protein